MVQSNKNFTKEFFMKKTAFIFMACVVLGGGVSGEVYEVSKSSSMFVRDNAKEILGCMNGK
ncbi:MAG: hypothetical protein RBS24_07335 [Bacilli bacterium]|nr:hypothetical protein [Bacilli bacterium]